MPQPLKQGSFTSSLADWQTKGDSRSVFVAYIAREIGSSLGKSQIRVNAMLATSDFKPSDVGPNKEVQRLENYGPEGKLDIKSVKGYSDGGSTRSSTITCMY